MRRRGSTQIVPAFKSRRTKHFWLSGNPLHEILSRLLRDTQAGLFKLTSKNLFHMVLKFLGQSLLALQFALPSEHVKLVPRV